MPIQITSKVVQGMQVFACFVILSLFSAATIMPMFGFKIVDTGMGETVKNIVLILIGFLFGSSAASAKKDDTNAALTSQLLTTPPVPTVPAAPVTIDDTTPIRTQEVPR